MKSRTLIISLFVSLVVLTSCILSPNNGNADIPNGCYRFSMPDHGSPDPNPPLVDYYMQFWADGTGEGGFWDTPLTESYFFEWAINEGAITFTPDFDIFGQADYSYVKTDSSEYILHSSNDSDMIKIYLSEDIVSRVDFTTSTIIGDWTNPRGDIYTFTADSLIRDGFRSTSWKKSSIPHVIEFDWAQWAVRVVKADTVIMAGYNNILSKQP
ncbi:MAG: hypothetical protein WCT23_01490 [Candidatus Neomarinimicrobiota bacterium]